jgi:murein L,D-transpeptidase YafK
MRNFAIMILISHCFWPLSALALTQKTDFALLLDHTLQPAALVDVAQAYPHVIIAELSTGKLHIYRRQKDNSFLLLETMETSIGKEGYGKKDEGDNKTPVGVYRIVSYLTPEQLDDFYGNAAYPVNYPNAWDRLQERTGYGIWLHAEPIGFKEKTRPTLDSNGCIVLSNNDIDRINQYIDIGYTYIVMTPKMEVANVEDVKQLRASLHERLQSWIAAWESLAAEPYLAFYSQQFSNLEKNWEQWVSYKTRVNKSKKFIDVAISDVGIYAYPGEENMVWIEYFQTYSSSNFQSVGWKRQLWKLEADKVWRIIYEGGG